MKTIKKIILSCLAVLLVGGICYGVWYLNKYVLYYDYKDYLLDKSYEESREFTALADPDPKVTDMSLVAENDNFKLYARTTTGELAVYDKRNGEIIYSNPQDADSDAIARDVNISFLKSQMIVEFYNANLALTVYNSYDQCVALNQLKAESVTNGVRFIYTLGDTSNPTGIVPTIIKEDRLTAVIDTLNEIGEESAAKYIKKRYMKSKTQEGFLELAGKSGLATFNKLNEYFTLAGYTAEDYAADMEASGAEVEIPLSITIPVDFTLNNTGLQVSINTEKIIETNGAKVAKIQLLRYMDAGSSSESGYLVLPNGSGSVMNFNNGRFAAAEYTQSVYGMDPLVQDDEIVELTEDARLAMFGISKEKHDTLVTIEDGSSLAAISACVAGKYNSYNFAYPTFIIRTDEVMVFPGQTGNESQMTLVEPNLYKANLTVQYSILSEDYKGYSGMASFYRDRLIAEGKLTKQEAKTDIPMFMDVIGAVKRTNYFLGSQYRETFSVTNYEQAGKMVDELADADIKNIIMNYQGWFNGGYYHDVPDKLKLVKKLGSERDLEDLSAKIEANGGKLYGDVALQKVTVISKRYKSTVETSRYFAYSVEAEFGMIDPVSLDQYSSFGYQERRFYMLSPRFLPRYVEDFTDEITSIDITGISLRDLGSSLISDKRRTRPINREEALQVVEGQLKKVEETGKDLLINKANDYAFAYATDIENVPMAHNDFSMVNYEIPFYQMILHGYVNYCGSSINLMDYSNRSEVILKLLEYGAAPHFVFSYEDSTELKYTGLNEFYSTTFDKWKGDAISIYNDVNAVLKHVQGSSIVKHEILDSAAKVKKITYDNGVIIYVNTSNKAVMAGNIEIPANGYEMEGVNE